MRLSTLFLLLLTFLCLTLAQGAYEDCCLRYVAPVKKRLQRTVVQYRRQEVDGDCNIPAVVFIRRRGNPFCANPREQWVKKLMNSVDKLLARKGPRKNF